MLPMKVKERMSVDPTVRQGISQVYVKYPTYEQEILRYKTFENYNLGGEYSRLQTVDRRGEPAFRRTRKFLRDNGGPFRVDRARVEVLPTATVDVTSPKADYYYFSRYSGSGALGGYPGWPLAGKVVSGTDLKNLVVKSGFSNDLNTWGAKAYNRLSPLNPSASVGQALAELMFDGLPTLPLKLLARHKALRALGGEYLNVQFGWLPFLSDIRKLYDTWAHLNERLAQIYRDNGRPVRRRAVLRNLINNSESYVANYALTWPNGSGIVASPQPPSSNPYWRVSSSTQTLDKIWCAGQFRYNIPNLADDRWTDGAKLALFGLNPTPELLWQVMPWSWLIDWFADVGDVIANFSSNGIADLVTDYCYLMRHQRSVTTWSGKQPPVTVQNSLGQESVIPAQTSLRTTFVVERKERIAASPFGFGLRLSDLSARQLAILAALGLSRQNFL